MIWTTNATHVYGDMARAAMKIKYRVFSKGRNAVGPSKSLIFWTFPDVLAFFDHPIWAIFHSSTFGTYD